MIIQVVPFYAHQRAYKEILPIIHVFPINLWVFEMAYAVYAVYSVGRVEGAKNLMDWFQTS